MKKESSKPKKGPDKETPSNPPPGPKLLTGAEAISHAERHGLRVTLREKGKTSHPVASFARQKYQSAIGTPMARGLSFEVRPSISRDGVFFHFAKDAAGLYDSNGGMLATAGSDPTLANVTDQQAQHILWGFTAGSAYGRSLGNEKALKVMALVRQEWADLVNVLEKIHGDQETEAKQAALAFLVVFDPCQPDNPDAHRARVQGIRAKAREEMIADLLPHLSAVIERSSDLFSDWNHREVQGRHHAPGVNMIQVQADQDAGHAPNSQNPKQAAESIPGYVYEAWGKAAVARGEAPSNAEGSFQRNALQEVVRGNAGRVLLAKELGMTERAVALATGTGQLWEYIVAKCGGQRHVYDA